MKYPDLVKDSTTTTGTGPITVAGVAGNGFQPFPAGMSVGDQFGYKIGDSGVAEWETGIGTLTASLTFSRSPTASSNGGALVNFGAGTKTVIATAVGVLLAKFMSTESLAFSATIPLSQPGASYMPQQSVTGVLAFTAAASPVQGALVYVRLVADGTNAPTFTGFTEHGSSQGYDNRNGIVNIAQFFYDGVDAWYSVSQAVNATPVDNVAPTASSAAVANATPSTVAITMSEAMDTAYVPAATAFTVGGHTVSSVAISGSTINLTVTPAFVNGEAARTVAYTQPGTNNARDAAGNLLANFSGLAITNNVQPADTTAPTFSSAQVANAAPSQIVITMNETLASSVPATSAFTASGKTVTAVAVSGSSVTLTVESAYLNGDVITVSYTQPGANPRLQDAAGNLTASFGPSSVTNNVAAAGDTTAPTLSSPTGTQTGANTASGSVSTNEANGTLYYLATTSASATVSAVKAGASQAVSATGVQNVSFTGLNASTVYYAHFVHRDAAGNDSAVSTSASFTTAAAAGGTTATRFGSLVSMTESGTGPYSYTGTGVSISGTTGQGGISLINLQSGVDGSLQVTVTKSSGQPGLGTTTGTTPVGYNSMPQFLYAATSKYTPFTNGTNNGASVLNTVVPADTDIMRLRRVGTTMIGEVSKDNGSTWTEIYQWTGVSTGVLRFQGLTPGAANTSILSAPAGVGLA